jgi:UTP:GlnB (protein PII) uridylyltransferase
LLSTETLVLADAEVDVLDATVATWGDGCALASFRARASSPPDAEALEAELRSHLGRSLSPSPVPDATVGFDDDASPWHTVCRVDAPDRPGLLHAITSAFAAAAVSVHSARVTTEGRIAVDLFELTDRNGHKLEEPTEAAIRAHLASGAAALRRWRGPGNGVRSRSWSWGRRNGRRESTDLKHIRDNSETTAP